MKVHLIRKETIEEYEAAHSGSRTSFREFLSKLKFADWASPADIKASFPTADLLGKGCNRAHSRRVHQALQRAPTIHH